MKQVSIFPKISASFCLVIFHAAFSSCNNEEIGSSKDVNPDAVFFDYAAWGDEEGGDVTLKIQYRYGGPDGTTLVLDPPSNVTLDGVAVPVDSSSLSGAYYEATRPAASFGGEHSIIFTDIKGKKFENRFTFPFFTLASDLPTQIRRDSLVLNLEGINPDDEIKLLMTDTSSYGKGIDTLYKPINGQIVVSAEAIGRLKNGPIHLVLYNDKEAVLRQVSPEGGKLSLSYNLKRELELQD